MWQGSRGLARSVAQARQSEKSWRTIRQNIPALSAEDLIAQVLKARWSAVGSVNRVFGVAATEPGRPPVLRGFNAEWAEFLPALRSDLRRKLSGTPLAVDVAAALEWAASDVRQLHDRYFGHGNQVQFPFKRQGPNDDRARDAFEELMGEFFQKHTKRKLKLHEVVAVLSEIAIPGEPVDPESIARRQSRRRPKD
jgi:hypothetical protein